MRTLFLLVALVFAAPSFADSRVWACVSSYAPVPAETWFSNMGDAKVFCDSKMGWSTTSPPQVPSHESFTTFDGIHTYAVTFTQAVSGLNRSYMMVEYTCIDPDAYFNPSNFECINPSRSLSADDIAIYVGYILGAFGLGFAMGYLFRVFYKAVDMI